MMQFFKKTLLTLLFICIWFVSFHIGRFTYINLPNYSSPEHVYYNESLQDFEALREYIHEQEKQD